MMQRRELLGATALTALAAMLGGCATRASGTSARFLVVATGQTLSREDWLAQARRCDFLLLGERHDNPHHHRLRGELLAALGPASPVVAEHLTRGLSVPAEGEALARLQAGGFDPKGWQWPLHAPLFEPALAPGHRLSGGNIPRELARDIARRGAAALPPELAAVLEAAPLDAAATAALDADLVQGHCGMLAGERLAGMRWAQRARDASMWLALREAQAAAPGAPALLLAGNGHVRRDYGVPALIRRHAPQARWMALGLMEEGAAPEPAAPYTHLCITEGVAQRGDPCAGFAEAMKKSAARPAAPASAASR